MIGEGLDVVVLLDTDRAREEARDGLVKKWLTRYREPRAEVLSLGPAAGMTKGDFAVEDLFPEGFYLNAVEEVYEKALTSAALASPPVGEPTCVWVLLALRTGLRSGDPNVRQLEPHWQMA
jgi:hypothetical protein